MDNIGDALRLTFELEGSALNWWQMAVRAALIYVSTLVMLRIGEKRVMGKNTAFDVILGFILGSVAGRAINGGATLVPTLVACAVLVGLHWLFAAASYRWHGFGELVKGQSKPVIENGEYRRDHMHRSHLTERDLEEYLRLEGTNDPKEVEVAYFERNGDVSVIKRKREPRVVEVAVEAGVQRVRIQVE